MAIDPGGDAVSGSPPPSPAAECEDGQVVITEAEGQAPMAGEQVEAEEVGMKRLSLQTVRGMTKDQDGEEVKSQEESGSAESEQVAVETDGEEGM